MRKQSITAKRLAEHFRSDSLMEIAHHANTVRRVPSVRPMMSEYEVELFERLADVLEEVTLLIKD